MPERSLILTRDMEGEDRHILTENFGSEIEAKVETNDNGDVLVKIVDKGVASLEAPMKRVGETGPEGATMPAIWHRGHKGELKQDAPKTESKAPSAKEKKDLPESATAGINPEGLTARQVAEGEEPPEPAPAVAAAPTPTPARAVRPAAKSSTAKKK